MKKIIISFLCVAICSLALASSPAWAVEREMDAAVDQHETFKAIPRPDDILPPKDELIQNSRTKTKVDLPDANFKYEFIPQLINIILGLAGTLAFIAFTVAGVMLVTAHGNEEQVTKAKQILLYSVIGLIVLAVAYAVVYGIFTISLE